MNVDVIYNNEWGYFNWACNWALGLLEAKVKGEPRCLTKLSSTNITNPKSQEREPSRKDSSLFLMVLCIGGPEWHLPQLFQKWRRNIPHMAGCLLDWISTKDQPEKPSISGLRRLPRPSPNKANGPWGLGSCHELSLAPPSTASPETSPPAATLRLHCNPSFLWLEGWCFLARDHKAILLSNLNKQMLESVFYWFHTICHLVWGSKENCGFVDFMCVCVCVLLLLLVFCVFFFFFFFSLWKFPKVEHWQQYGLVKSHLVSHVLTQS